MGTGPEAGRASEEIVVQVRQRFQAKAAGPLPEETIALIDGCARRSLERLGLADLAYGLAARHLVPVLVRDVQRCLERGCDAVWW